LLRNASKFLVRDDGCNGSISPRTVLETSANADEGSAGRSAPQLRNS